MDQYIGKLLDNRYEILERIGMGGMSVVYKARCHRLNRLVAVKILKEELAQDADFRRRFHDESQAVAMLSHPNIVAVYDVSRSSELDYIVMELIDGITLKQYMQKKQGKLSWREALHFITQIVKALSHAHSRGIIHRDIKPHNVMILRDGSLKVADFGIARLTSSSQSTLTQEALGSVHYISPEQARGSRIDARSDIYSAGVVLYEMITGRLPYEGDSPVSVAIQHINSVPLSPRELDPDIPEALEKITLKAMASDVNQRYISADSMLADLEEFRKNPNINFDYTPADLLVEENDEPTHVIGANTPYTVKQQPVHRREEEPVPSKRRRQSAPRERDDYYDDYDDRQGGSHLPMVLAIVAIIVFLGGMAAFLWVSFFSGFVGATGTKTYNVPNLTGLTIEEARNRPDVQEAQFDIVVGQTVDSDMPEGQIIGQSPDSSMNAAAGATITVTLSGGISIVPDEGALMPNLENQDQRSALNILRNLGFSDEDIIIEEENSDDYTREFVISQTPEAKTPLADVEKITLVVSLGPKVEQSTVISFVQMTEADARANAERLKLNVGSVEKVYDSEIEEGRICYQSIAPNTKVNEGTTINFRVSMGPDPATVETPEPTPIATPEPTPPPEDTPVTNTWTFQVELPDDGRETVTVRVMVGDVEAARHTDVDTRLNSILVTVSGSGMQTVTVYIDDKELKSTNHDFGS